MNCKINIRIIKRKFILKTALLFALMSCVCAAACAPAAVVKHTRPAKYHVEGIKKIGVLPFVYERFDEQEGGKLIRESLVKAVRDKDFFETVELAGDAPYEFDAGGIDTGGLLQICKSSGVDALILGKMLDYKVDTKKSWKKKETDEGTGTYRNEEYTENGVRKLRRVEIKKTEVVPVVEKNAKVSFEIGLFSAARKELIDRRLSEDSEQENAEGKDQVARLPVNSEWLGEISEKLVKKSAGDLTPTAVTEKRRFVGDGACKDGLNLAKDGDLIGAIANWRVVVNSDSSNYAANYNIGVAEEAGGNFAAALESYEAACRIKRDGRCTGAIKRADSLINDQNRLKEQMKGRK